MITKNNMSTLTRKSLINSLLVGVVFAISLALPSGFGYITLALIVLVLVLWKFFFDVDLKLPVMLEKSKFLILPILFNLGSLYLTTLFFQTFAKGLISLAVVIANYYLWVALRKVHNLSDRAAILHRNVLIVVSFMTVFLGSTTIFRLFMLLNTSASRGWYQLLLTISIFLLFYVVSYFLTWENGANDDIKKLRPYNIVNSLLGAEVAWISSVWIVNYPVIAIQEKANLGGTPLPAVLLAIIFYFLWGIIFHKLDYSLTRRVLTEYIFVAILFITVLLVTARWLPTF